MMKGEDMSIAIVIKGQYLFRGRPQNDSEPVGIIYPDTSRGKVFAAAPGESFTHQELCAIAEFVKNKAFSRLGRKTGLLLTPKKPPVRARPVTAQRAKASSK